jgi:hypothetical protein
MRFLHYSLRALLSFLIVAIVIALFSSPVRACDPVGVQSFGAFGVHSFGVQAFTPIQTFAVPLAVHQPVVVRSFAIPNHVRAQNVRIIDRNTPFNPFRSRVTVQRIR